MDNFCRSTNEAKTSEQENPGRGGVRCGCGGALAPESNRPVQTDAAANAGCAEMRVILTGGVREKKTATEKNFSLNLWRPFLLEQNGWSKL